MLILSPLTGDVRNPMVAEAFFASHMYQLPITTAGPRAKVDIIHNIPREHAKTVVAAAASRRSDAVVDMKTPLEQVGTYSRCPFDSLESKLSYGWLSLTLS